MDIDFHYYATYIAARFAGYGREDALTIATAAQTIDENGRHVLVDDDTGLTTGLLGVPDDFEVRGAGDGSSVHTYRVQMTFQGQGDIGTSANDTVSSIWPVYHFLPGNFVPASWGAAPPDLARAPGERIAFGQRGGWAVRSSTRWRRRAFGGSADAIAHKFRWLCRPHSPMAIGLVNNATDMVHDPQSVVRKHGLDLYLVGVTMHVFIDTWAHQDFIGPASRAINSVRHNPALGFMATPTELPTLVGDQEPSETAQMKAVKLVASEWKTRMMGTSQFLNPILGHGEEKNVYVGHGQVGHFPDHSALIWSYTPSWSGSFITRANPVNYIDAFLHMTYAMYCIRNGLQYAPFDVTVGNVAALCSTIDVRPQQLLAVYKHFTKKRSPWGTGHDPEVPKQITDPWDHDIYSAGLTWQTAIREEFGVDGEPPASWLPGKSKWVMDAYEAHAKNQSDVQHKRARKGNYFTVGQFAQLDFFKFNLAAKCHYRFVKQQLIAFDEMLLGSWPDGAAYADDLSFAEARTREAWLVESLKVLGDIQRKTKLRELSEGMAILVDDVVRAVDDAGAHRQEQLGAAVGVLRNVLAAVDSKADFTYGIRQGAKKEITTAVVGIAGKDALNEINKLVAKLAQDAGPSISSPLPARSIVLMSYSEWKAASSAALSRRQGDAHLKALDEAYKELMQWLGGPRTLKPDDGEAVKRARRVVGACNAWLGAGTGRSGRADAIKKLRQDIWGCIGAPS